LAIGTITLVLVRAGEPESFTGAHTGNMQHRHAAGFIVVLFIVLGILGVLAAIAIPHADKMLYSSKTQAREMEFLQIQNAVIEMLRESPIGMLEPIGPTADISKVRTRDTVPLFLTDYLVLEKDNAITSGYKYGFTADGTVIRYAE